jgi:hypothetical protein
MLPIVTPVTRSWIHLTTSAPYEPHDNARPPGLVVAMLENKPSLVNDLC